MNSVSRKEESAFSGKQRQRTHCAGGVGSHALLSVIERRATIQGKDDAHENAGRDRRVEGEAVALDEDVAGNPPEPEPRQDGAPGSGAVRFGRHGRGPFDGGGAHRGAQSGARATRRAARLGSAPFQRQARIWPAATTGSCAWQAAHRPRAALRRIFSTRDADDRLRRAAAERVDRPPARQRSVSRRNQPPPQPRRHPPASGDASPRAMSRPPRQKGNDKRVAVIPDVRSRTFPASGITASLDNGGTLENDQTMAAHESSGMTNLFDRMSDETRFTRVSGNAI